VLDRTKAENDKEELRLQELYFDAIKALIHCHQNQLLNKLLEEAITIGMDAIRENEWELKKAVPVEAINKLRSK
jgi:hypothetical protein